METFTKHDNGDIGIDGKMFPWGVQIGDLVEVSSGNGDYRGMVIAISGKNKHFPFCLWMSIGDSKQAIVSLWMTQVKKVTIVKRGLLEMDIFKAFIDHNPDKDN